MTPTLKDNESDYRNGLNFSRLVNDHYGGGDIICTDAVNYAVRRATMHWYTTGAEQSVHSQHAALVKAIVLFGYGPLSSLFNAGANLSAHHQQEQEASHTANFAIQRLLSPRCNACSEMCLKK